MSNLSSAFSILPFCISRRYVLFCPSSQRISNITLLLPGVAPRSSVGRYFISLIGEGSTLRRKSLSRAASSGIPDIFPKTALKVQSMNSGANLTGTSLFSFAINILLKRKNSPLRGERMFQANITSFFYFGKGPPSFCKQVFAFFAFFPLATPH